MPNNLTDFEENRLLDLSITNGTVYLGLFTVAPGETGGGTEVSGGSYARQAIPATNAASGGSKSNSATITFPAATATWGTIVGYGIMDAATAGNMRWFRPLSAGEQRTINTGDTYTVASGALTFTLD